MKKIVTFIPGVGIYVASKGSYFMQSAVHRKEQK